ncbi:MAG: hypothetical protein ACYCZ1_08835 [Candidatus Humimicrobiaceae bacterium]
MTIRTTAILIILTLIFAVVFIYFLNQDSRITELIVTQDPLNTAKTEKAFTDNKNDIFLLIKLSKVKKGEKIKISWYKNTGENSNLLIQDNNILIENQGSGFIKISLVNKNGNYENGNYQINVSLNGNPEKPLDFSIN